MLATLEKIAARQEEYGCQVDVLGPCTIENPLRNVDYVDEGERISSEDILTPSTSRAFLQPSCRETDSGPWSVTIFELSNTRSWTRSARSSATGPASNGPARTRRSFTIRAGRASAS